MSAKRIIVIDDRQPILTAIDRILRVNGWSTDCHTSSTNFLVACASICDANPAHALVVDIEMHPTMGPAVVELALDIVPSMRGRVVFFSSIVDEKLLSDAAKFGPVISKSDTAGLIAALRSLPEKR